MRRKTSSNYGHICIKKNNLQKNKLDIHTVLYSLETWKPHDLQLIIYHTVHYRIRA